MKSLVIVVFAAIFLTTTDACSCFRISSRQESLRDGVCWGDVFVATVTGAICNCFPNGEERQNINCQDYRLQSPSVITAELTSRARCDAERGIYGIYNCSELATRLAPRDYRVQGPQLSTNVTVRNTTLSSGSCYLSCPFNDPEDDTTYYEIQPCFYTVSISEVIKGNYTVGQTVMTSGPDVLTSCGNYMGLLRIDQQYVVGVGGPCSDISQWSTLQSYSPSELQQLRGLARIFEDGGLYCGAFGLLPSLSLLLVAIAVALL